MRGEPTLESIEDFDNNESPQKRKMVKTVIIGLLILSAFYGAVKFTFSSVSDEIPTAKDAVYK
jgi:predicted secreted protein